MRVDIEVIQIVEFHSKLKEFEHVVNVKFAWAKEIFEDLKIPTNVLLYAMPLEWYETNSKKE
jgi:hypothetical protein